jgi:hypothetical protein
LLVFVNISCITEKETLVPVSAFVQLSRSFGSKHTNRGQNCPESTPKPNSSNDIDRLASLIMQLDGAKAQMEQAYSH